MTKDLRQTRPKQSPAETGDHPQASLGRAPEVGLLVDTATAWGRSIIAGVGAYSQSHGGWVLRFEPSGGRHLPELPAGWHGDGIIARVSDPALRDRLRDWDIPVVNISTALPENAGLPTINIDSAAIAQAAADHLTQRGLRHFGYLGLKNRWYSRERWRLFRDALGSTADSVATLELTLSIRSERQAWQRREGLIRWLRDRPRPCGVFVWTDDLARLALEACQLAGLRVPEDIAVLGVDNDELLCNLTSPPLSSVELGTDRIGYRAAELLHQAMTTGQKPPPGLENLEPVGVIDRQSTNLLSMSDTQIAEALRFIWDQFYRPIQVGDALAQTDLSRRSFERRFRNAVGRTPAAEIRRVRLDHARRLLLETDRTVADIACRCGFDYPEHLISAFRTAFGDPPQRYRHHARQHRVTARID